MPIPESVGSADSLARRGNPGARRTISNHQNGTVVLRPLAQAKPVQLKPAELKPAQAKAAKAPPPRGRNASRRSREYLPPSEVERVTVTAKARGRWGQRDAVAILLGFSHGFRVSELVALTWSQIDFKDGVIQVKRLKNGRASTQPLRGAEIR